MTKQDHRAIAEVFASVALDNDSLNAQWVELRTGIARVFAVDNPQFNIVEFYAATQK